MLAPILSWPSFVSRFGMPRHLTQEGPSRGGISVHEPLIVLSVVGGFLIGFFAFSSDYRGESLVSFLATFGVFISDAISGLR